MEQTVYEQLLEKEKALQGESDSCTINCFFNSVRQTDQNEETVVAAGSAQDEEWTELQNVDMSNIDELSESSGRDAVDTHLFSETFQSLSPSEDISTDMDLRTKTRISVGVLNNFQEDSSTFTQLHKQRAESSMGNDMEEAAEGEVEEEVEVEGDEEEEEEIEVEEGEEEGEEEEDDDVEEDDDDDDENLSSSSVPVTPPSTASKIDNWLIDKEVSEHRNVCYVLENNKSSEVSAVDKNRSKLPSETPWGFSVRDAKEDSFCQLEAHRKRSISLEMTLSKDESSSDSDEPSDQSVLNTKLAQNAGNIPMMETTAIPASVKELSRTLPHGLLTAAEELDSAHKSTRSLSESVIFTSGASYFTLPAYRERKPTSANQEHLSKSTERMQSGHWISDICQSTHSDTLESPSLKDNGKSSDGGANLSISQEQALIENPVQSSQALKEAVNQHLYVQKSSDSALAQRKTVLTESEFSSHTDIPDCMLGSENRETSIDVSGRNRHWNVGTEKEIVPFSIRNDPISSKLYGSENTPYITSVVVHEKGEDGDCTEEEEDFVFTCIECSIYFKKKEHLIEHMQQHNQTPDQSGTGTSGQSQYSCTECGWIFGDTDSLEQHQRLHQESRERFMEEIQKLSSFPDEGREAKLQCSKCLFGTNSPRTFVQHCKTHSKDKTDQEWNADLVGGANQDQPDSPVQNIYMHSSENDFPSQTLTQKNGKDSYTCTTCSFSTASESVLTEHIKYRHTDHSQENDIFKETTDFPSTSKDSFSLPRTNKFEDTEFTSSDLSKKTDNNLSLSSSMKENLSLHENIPPFPRRLQRASKSFRSQRDAHSSLFQKSKPPGYFSTQKKFGNWSFHSADGYYHQHSGPKVHYGVHQIQSRGASHQTGDESENERKHQKEQILKRQQAESGLTWSSSVDAEGRKDNIYSDSNKTLAKQSWNSFKVPQAALELKKNFGAILRNADSLFLSEDQQHQIRNMVPIVVLEQVNTSPQPIKGWKRKLLFKRRRKRRTFGLSARELMKGYHPSEFDLPFDDCLDPSLLSPDSPLLKNEEKKCPYCPDKFHNGIGLANHIRGHLNRVGVSYNVRHFISADEVKAIEQKFSFQKKKKKATDAEPDNDVRCSFCGEFFENKKGLSSHSRSHLRQMGVTEWYMNGSPIETLKDVVKRRTQARGVSAQQGQKTITKPQSGSSGILEQRVSEQQQQSSLMTKKFTQDRSPDHPHSGSPTARKMFPGLPPPSLQKKLKPDSVRMEFKRDMSGSIQSDHQPNVNWSTQNELSALNLSAGPNSDTRCMFCGEYFENKKGLSSHARSHLRQMGVTEWSVNGSPIDTLRELVKKKSKALPLKRESPTLSSDPSKRILEDRPGSKSPVKIPPGMTLSPIGGRIMKSNLTISSVNREHSVTPISKKTQMGFMTPMPTKRPMLDERFLQSEPKHKSYLQTELPFKSKSMSPEKITSPSPDASCELCGLCFENRKALASHARAHLRQFGVTEWCVNGSPIETLSEWIKRKPQKAGAYRSYIQGGHAFMKKFRTTPVASEHGEAGRKLSSSSSPGGLPGTARAIEKEMHTHESAEMMDFNTRSDVRITSPSLLRDTGTLSQRHNINKFERRQAKMSDFSLREDEADDFRSPSDEIRSTSQKVKPVPSLLPRPPQTSLVKFVGNIYTLKCRFCEVEFHGPLSIQEDWVRHLQRHILNMSVSKADALRSERAASDMQGVTDGYQHS